MSLDLNLNTLLTSLVLAGILWQIRSTQAQHTAQALSQQRQDQAEREMVEIRARVAAAEASIAEVSLKVARMEARDHLPSG